MKKIVLAVLLLLLMAVPATAKTVFNFPAGYTQAEFKDLSTDMGLALSYVPLAPAEPLGGGLLPHVDVGVEASAVKIDKDQPYWSQAATDLPRSLIFPKFHAQLGLPVIPIDIGFVYSKVRDSDIKLTGGEIKWAILKGGTVTPAIALRGAYTRLSGVSVLDISTKSLDISISKGFLMFSPYAGVGEVWISSKAKDPSVPLLQKEDITRTKSFVGCKLSFLPILNIVVEADFAKVNEYSLRLNLHF
jgi:hypothetical protein